MTGTRSKSKEKQTAIGDSNGGKKPDEGSEICEGGKNLRCGTAVKEGDNGLQCDLCRNWYHSACQDVPSKVYEILQHSSLAWLCDYCKDRLPFLRKCVVVGESVLDSSACLERIERKIDEVKVEVGKQERIEKKIDGLKTEDTARSTSIPQVIEECMKKAEENKKDEDKRRCNVVVANMAESQAAQSSDRTDEDVRAFTDLVKHNLRLNVKVKKAFRVGAKKGDKPRPLVVTLESEAVKWDILKQGRLLREAEDELVRKVYINPDLPKEERERQWKVREECRARKAKGENVRVVKGKCVVVEKY